LLTGEGDVGVRPAAFQEKESYALGIGAGGVILTLRLSTADSAKDVGAMIMRLELLPSWNAFAGSYTVSKGLRSRL